MLYLAFLFVVDLLLLGKTMSHSVPGPHIADVNILLPPKMTNDVEYRLQGSDGCFTWSWDHHDILSVLPEYNFSSYCSTSARLRSIAPYSGRKETAIYATDVHSGIVIRCKVFIDKLSRIQIFHNAVKLDLDGLATLRVRAFDNEENVFSSLVGVQFMWELMPLTLGLSHHLVHLPLKESPLSDCGGLCGDLDIQIKLEDSGVFSDLFVVRGIEVGHERVSVGLIEPQIKQMEDKIVLTVAEAMSLDPPSPIYVLIGAAVQYSLKVIRANKFQEAALPSSHYQWSVLNISVAEVDSFMGLAYALRLGVTTVMVEDTRISGHFQMSVLNVVLPDSLCLYTSPFTSTNDSINGVEATASTGRWYIVSGHQYLIQFKVFTQGPHVHEIFITENDEIKLDDPSEYWRTSFVPNDVAFKYRWQNSRILRATSQGQGVLTASLSYFNGSHGSKEVLKFAQEIIVCDRMKFMLDTKFNASQSILLPWAPSIYQEVELKATGGCAKRSRDYKWLSSDDAILSVSAFGVVQAKRPGKATVKVVSVFDSSNYDEVVIEVSTPSSLVMLHNFPVETVVGTQLRASVTMKASNGAYFYGCDAFNYLIRWTVGSESFNIVNVTEVEPFLYPLGIVEPRRSVQGPPCSWTYVYASGSDHTMLHATLAKEYLHVDHSLHRYTVPKASLHIAAYPPLIVQQASDGSKFGGYWFNLSQSENGNWSRKLEKSYLVPGTHLDVMLKGGPKQWGKDVKFIETVEVLDEVDAEVKDEVLVHRLSSNYEILYRVLCQTQGTFKITFRRGNLVGEDHLFPTIAEVFLAVVCSIPASISLIVDEPVNGYEVIQSAIQVDRSPGRIRVAPLSVANGRSIRISAIGISDSEEPFANSSSLCLRWELSNCVGLAHWIDVYDSEKYSWERLLSLGNKSGLCIIRAAVINFCNAMGDYSSLQLPQGLENVLTDAVPLQLVSTLRVIPEFNLFYVNLNAKVNLSIIGGSSLLEAVVNDTQVLEVIQPASGPQCQELMLSLKGLGTALLTVFDVGLTTPLKASSLVQVADIDWIRITSQEEISFVEGSSKVISLMVGTNDGNTFDSSQFASMALTVHIEDDIVEVVGNADVLSSDNDYVNAPNFEIKAIELGFTTLFVRALQLTGHEIFSQTIKVEVYPLPTIHPGNIFLLPGASYVVSVHGGPTVGTSIEFESEDSAISCIHKSSGKLSALAPGNTTIHATFLGPGTTIICRTDATVKVEIPSTVMLNVQNEQLGIGRGISIYPLFPEGDLFSFYELCKSYRWTVEDEKVLSFRMLDLLDGETFGSRSISSKEVNTGSSLVEKDFNFKNIFYGRSPGRTNVSVSFWCEFMTSGSSTQTRSYSASASLLVVPDLPIALGIPVTWVLPPYYTTGSILTSSVVSYGQLDGQSMKGAISYSLLQKCGERNEVIQKDAMSIDGDQIKTAESNALACIQAKDRSSGRMEIAACVRVSEVAQIRIKNPEFDSNIINLAVGDELTIPLTYFDPIGNIFHEAHNCFHVSVATNYPDVVSLNFTREGNGYVKIKAKQHSRALVRVSIDNDPKKSDYILIAVGAIIHPQNPVVHVGTHLNFSIKGMNDRITGQWVAANKSVIIVNILSGAAVAFGEGTTEVKFEGSSLKLRTRIAVLSGLIVSVDAPPMMLTNVGFPAKGYNFSVKFSEKFDAIGHDKGITYDCLVEPPFIGYAKPWLDLTNNNSFCLFFPYTLEHLAQSIPKSKNRRPDISISIYALTREANQASGFASALFVGGFSILDMSESSMMLNLSTDSSKTITILGNTEVEIHWREEDLKVAGPISKEDYGIGGRAQYEVKATGSKRFRDKIIIALPANGQRVEINVSYEPRARAAFDVTLWSRILGSVALILFTLGILIFYLDRPRRSRPSESTIPSTANVAAPVTPDRSSPVLTNDEHSPSTPQPFVDYVRQTIDETPYYRRAGRRRFNPQNTF